MKYNGHKNWNHWNVSLWINNDQGLYNTAKEYVRYCRNRNKAAAMMYERLSHDNAIETPDGARYSVSSIRAAMRGI